MRSEPHILIAGAGPAGCVAALILARAGIRITVFEAEADLPLDLRASTFHPPTLDMLAPLGLTARLLEMGLKAPTYQFRDRRSGDYATFDLGCLSDLTDHPFRLQCEQFKLTGIAAEALRDMPEAEVLFSRPVTGVEQDDDGVRVTVEGPDGAEIHAGDYLIAADGASSVVRTALDIGFDGFTYPDQWLVASTPHDFAGDFDGLAYVNYVADPEEWFVLLRVPALWRVLLPVAADATEADALSDATLQRRLQGIAAKDGDYTIAHRTLYRVHQRVAATYRVGRVALAGDSAHINNPLGGMGMNGGIHDAVNLAQKLERILRHGADADRMLDHYSAQRQAIATEYVQEHTHGNKQAIEETDPAKRRTHMERMQQIASDPALLVPFARKSAMIDAVARSMAVEPD